MKKEFKIKINVPMLANRIQTYIVSCKESEIEQVTEELKWAAYNEDVQENPDCIFVENLDEMCEVDSTSEAIVLEYKENK